MPTRTNRRQRRRQRGGASLPSEYYGQPNHAFQGSAGATSFPIAYDTGHIQNVSPGVFSAASVAKTGSTCANIAPGCGFSKTCATTGIQTGGGVRRSTRARRSSRSRSSLRSTRARRSRRSSRSRRFTRAARRGGEPCTATLRDMDGIETQVPFDTSIRVDELVREYCKRTGFGGAVQMFEIPEGKTGNEDNAAASQPLKDNQTITTDAKMIIIKRELTEIECLKSICSTSTTLQEKWSKLNDVAWDGKIPVDLEGVVVKNGHITELSISTHSEKEDLTKLPDLSPLVNLTDLSVSMIPTLTELPDLSALVNLTYLNVAHTSLTELPDLSALVNLTFLKVNNNQLTELPDLSKLTELSHLDVSQNKLEELPDLSKLTELSHLNVSQNQLKKLPDLSELTQSLTNLQILYVSDNPLEDSDRKENDKKLTAVERVLDPRPESVSHACHHCCRRGATHGVRRQALNLRRVDHPASVHTQLAAWKSAETTLQGHGRSVIHEWRGRDAPLKEVMTCQAFEMAMPLRVGPGTGPAPEVHRLLLSAAHPHPSWCPDAARRSLHLHRGAAQFRDFARLKGDGNGERDGGENLEADDPPRPVLATVAAKSVEPPYNDAAHDDREDEHEGVHALLRLDGGFIALAEDADDHTDENEDSGGAKAGGDGGHCGRGGGGGYVLEIGGIQ